MRCSRWVAVLTLLVALVNPGLSQSDSQVNINTKPQSKQEKQANKTKAKAAEKAKKANTGKKTSSQEDAAYAAAYKSQAIK